MNEEEVAMYIAKQRGGMASRTSRQSKNNSVRHQSPPTTLKKSYVLAHGSQAKNLNSSAKRDRINSEAKEVRIIEE